MRIRNLEDLERLAAQGRQTLAPPRPRISVGYATCGQAAGAVEVLKAIKAEVKERGIPCEVTETGCVGWCGQEPLVDVWYPGHGRVTYGRVNARVARAIVRGMPDDLQLEHAIAWTAEEENVLTGEHTRLGGFDGRMGNVPAMGSMPMFSRQVRIVSRNSGLIDPASLEEYAARGGYRALHRAVRALAPGEVVREVKASGLRGRGGGGYPTGNKWEVVARQNADQKYVIANGDEGDPGAYMDRTALESDPHSVLEGMAIGGYAMGATGGVIYVRDEYPLAVKRITEAIRQAEAVGLLGDDIFGSGFSFHLRVVKGAGAFVCGEETALIASIEGKVGEPRQRPPFPAVSGLNNRPTCINNVETWANVPVIIMRGSAWFAALGTEKSKGTKTFCLVGAVNNTGLVEVPMGITLGEIVHQIGGGIPEGRPAKAVQTGGPSGGCIPASKFDLPVDFDSLTQAGSIMGSGGMIVMDDQTCMVDIARYFMAFLEDESCGKCFSCRVGTQRLREVLDRIAAGEGVEADLQLLDELSWVVRETSMCGLGQSAANPVRSTIRYFRDEYLAHIREKRCPAKVCRALISFEIDPVTCNGCGACVRICSGNAILGEKNHPHHIEAAHCTKCGACVETCNFDAIVVHEGAAAAAGRDA